jgi:hypothetical protein
LRNNRTLTRIVETGFHLFVEESFPACPKYIQRKQPDLSGVTYRKVQDNSPFQDRVFKRMRDSVLLSQG